MIPESRILCVFEGEKREYQYFNTLKEIYFNEHNFILCSYGNDIYELYEEIKKDNDLDLIELIRESKNTKVNVEILKGYGRDDFSQIFLFFDLEHQDNKFTNEKIISLIETFNEETDSGKVFISYPMIEAIRDIPNDFSQYINHKVSIENSTGKTYKNLSTKGSQTFHDPRHKNKSDWDNLVKINVEKGNFIISKSKGNLTDIPEQKKIAEIQLKTIKNEENMYVLCSFPLFIFHQKSSHFDF